MTHTRNTPASRHDDFRGRERPSSDRHGDHSADWHGGRGGRVEPAGDVGTGGSSRFDERSVRARTEDMQVRALGSGRYAVHSESGHDYLVDVNERSCTCPDHAIRGARCKHMRRVAMEITAGSVAPPSYVASTCASCGGFALVPPGAPEPHLCGDHALAVGDRAWDRETEKVVLVVGVSPERADAVRIPDQDVTVAGYESNAAYPPNDPVVAAVYPPVRVREDGPQPGELRVYSFPLSRLERLDDGDGRGARNRGRIQSRARPN